MAAAGLEYSDDMDQSTISAVFWDMYSIVHIWSYIRSIEMSSFYLDDLMTFEVTIMNDGYRIIFDSWNILNVAFLITWLSTRNENAKTK